MFQLLGLFGSELTRFALPVWLFQQEKSLISFSIFMCCGLLPRIFSPIMGGFIDSFCKKRILIISGLSLVVISAVIVSITIGLVHKNFLSICALVFLTGFFSNLIHIGTLSMVPQMVEQRELLKANSLMIAAESSAVLICPVLAGCLVFKFGVSFVLFIDAILFLCSLLFIANIKMASIKQTSIEGFKGTVRKVRNNLVSGISFVVKDRKLVVLLAISGGLNFIFSFSFVAFTPMILIASNSSKLLGMINSAGSAAQLLTSVFAGYLLKSKAQVSQMMKSIALLGLCGPFIIGLKFSPIFWGIGYALTLSLLSIVNSLNNTFWQTRSPLDLQGTIFGVRRMISSLIAPIGMLLAGPLITLIFASFRPGFVENEYQMVFLVSGLLILFLGVTGSSLRILRQKDPVSAI